MSRRDDLERHIRESYDIIRQYEEIKRTSDRPEEKARARRNIEEQWGLVKGYLDQYQTLCQRLGKSLAEDILEIAVTLDAGIQAGPGPGPGQGRADERQERGMASLRTQLEEARANLLLIRERKSQYVMETDVPLDLIKRERQLEQQIANLAAQIPALKDSLRTEGLGDIIPADYQERRR